MVTFLNLAAIVLFTFMLTMFGLRKKWFDATMSAILLTCFVAVYIYSMFH